MVKTTDFGQNALIPRKLGLSFGLVVWAVLASSLTLRPWLGLGLALPISSTGILLVELL